MNEIKFEGIVYPQEDKQFFDEQNKYNEKFEIKEYKEVFKEKVACAVQQWIDVRNRGHHTFGDTLGDCFNELCQEESNIIQFPKK